MSLAEELSGNVLTFAATNDEVSVNTAKATTDNMSPLTLTSELPCHPSGLEVPQLDLL